MIKRTFTVTPLQRRITIIAGVTLSIAALAAACSGIRREKRAEWRAIAEIECIKSNRVRQTPYVKISKSINGPGVCGAEYPIKVSALTASVPQHIASNGNLMLTSGNMMLTSISPTATLSCPMVSGVDAWLGTDVQRAALTWFNQPVVELITFGSFSCRPMNNRVGARLSEHSFANAIDAKGFRLADGRIVTVAKGWRGQADEQGFLREVAFTACKHFSTVLAPGSDALHYDHIHVDLARHNRGRHVCRPALQMPSPPQQPAIAALVPAGEPLARSPLPPPGRGPVYKSEPLPQLAPSALVKPSPGATRTGELYSGPDEGPDGEVEDLQGEQNFDGRKYDITGSTRSPDDPPIVRQKAGQR